MSDPGAEQSEGQAASSDAAGMTEEEYRKAMEEELRKASVQDIVVQSVVTILNLTSRRIALEEERDLGQARLGIDVVGAISGYLPDEIESQVEQALSQLRMEFAKHADTSGGSGPEGEQGAGPEPAGPSQGGSQEPPSGSRLWTPPGS